MSKRLDEAKKIIDQTKLYSAEEAVKLVKQAGKVKFDAALEVHFRLNIDNKKSDQKVRIQVSLPNGTGKDIKVAAFVSPSNEAAAKKAKADVIGGEDLIKEIKQSSKTNFDIAVAEPEMMPKLAQIAKILGQRGLMPSPKTGTVGENIEKMINEVKSGKIDVKTDDSGNVHLMIGKLSFDDKKLVENYEAVKDAIQKAKPSGVKKEFIASIYLAATMGPSAKIK